MWRDRCLHSHETSRVCVRCSRTQSIYAVQSLERPLATRNLISAGRADEASSRAYAPQGLIYHSHGPAQSAAHARLIVFHPFLSFSVDTPMVHLFKLIELSLELPVWY
jgi:hypothetical protein